MICNACVAQITTISQIAGMGVRTNEIMCQLLEKEDAVRKLFRFNNNHYNLYQQAVILNSTGIE